MKQDHAGMIPAGSKCLNKYSHINYKTKQNDSNQKNIYDMRKR